MARKEKIRPIKTPYVVTLPILKFANISPLEPMESTRAYSPAQAVTHAIARGVKTRDKVKRSNIVGGAMNMLVNKLGTRELGRYAFEIPEQIYGESGKLREWQEDHENSRLYFLADELTKLHDDDPTGNLSIARKILDFYDSQR